MPKRPDVTQVEVPNPGLTLPPNKVQAAMQAHKTILPVVAKFGKNRRIDSKKFRRQKETMGPTWTTWGRSTP